MRDALLKRVRPLVERLATDLADLVVRRIEAEIDRMGEAFEVALSAYASHSGIDLLANALGPELAAMLDAPAKAKRERDYKPENYPPSRRDRGDRAKLQANGKKPVTCTSCGFVGGNARGCGTAHPTVPSQSPNAVPEQDERSDSGAGAGYGATAAPRPRPKADPDAEPMTAIAPTKPRAYTSAEIEAAKNRIQERRLRPKPEALAARRAQIAARIPAAPPKPPPESDHDEYDPNNLRPGLADLNATYELPEPIATFVFGGPR